MFDGIHCPRVFNDIIRHPCTSACLVLTAAIAAFPATAEQPSPSNLQSVHTCVEMHLAAISDGTSTLPDITTADRDMLTDRDANDPIVKSYSQAAVFEIVIYNMKTFRSQGVNTFCSETALPKYLNSYKRRDEERKKALAASNDPATLAPPGTHEIESGSFLADLYHNTRGKHDRGHSDLTRDALIKLYADPNIAAKCNCKPTQNDTDPKKDHTILISRASQAVDIFRWENEAYHAHTPDLRPNFSDTQIKQAVAKGKEAFLNVLRERTKNFYMFADDHIYQWAAFEMGVVSHLVQDMVYHHGITLRQHSGLAYVSVTPTLENPDYPGSTVADAAKAQAISKAQWDKTVDFTYHLFKIMLMKLDAVRIKSILTAQVKANAFTSVATQVFADRSVSPSIPGEPDIGLWSLAEYYLLHQEYVTTSDSSKDGTVPTAAIWDIEKDLRPYQDRQKPWVPEDMLQQMTKVIVNGG